MPVVPARGHPLAIVLVQVLAEIGSLVAALTKIGGKCALLMVGVPICWGAVVIVGENLAEWCWQGQGLESTVKHLCDCRFCITWWLCTYRPVRREDLRRCRWNELKGWLDKLWDIAVCIECWSYSQGNTTAPARTTHWSADEAVTKGCSLFPNMFACQRGIRIKYFHVSKSSTRCLANQNWVFLCL